MKGADMRQTIIRIELENLKWFVTRDPKSGMFVGECEPLKLTAEGESQMELIRDMNDAVQELFRFLTEGNEFHSFLRRAGWDVQVPLPPKARPEELEFDVPWSVLHEKISRERVGA